MTSVPRALPVEDRAADRPHVLIVMADGQRRAELVRGISSQARVSVLERGGLLPELSPMDVAVVHADSMNQACAPLFGNSRLGFPEIVFVVDEAGSPQHFALKSRGFRYVVGLEVLSDWLATVLMQLTAVTRARRIVLGACTDGPMAPEVPALNLTARARRRLREAETSFRDTFMRALLAECGSRRKAADEAGVPYRSFCEMLRKLGI